MPVKPPKPPDHFIVFIPGYMGSKLRDKRTGEIVWVDFNTLPANPLDWDDWLYKLIEKITYPNPDLEPAGLVEEVQFLLPWVKQEHYGRLLEALAGMGYRVDAERFDESRLDVYTFPYDWRQDNRVSAQQLAAAIDGWRRYHPNAEVWIMAHSNGGIIARWYIEMLGGKEKVGRLFLFASPWDGAPKALGVLRDGLEMMWRRVFSLIDVSELSKKAIRSFPSAYNLVPLKHPFLQDQAGRPLDPYSDTHWLDTDQERALLEAGGKFNEELGTRNSVETLCFFGRQRMTVTEAVVRIAPGGGWDEVSWKSTAMGDGTVPEFSAAHPDADALLPFNTSHGDIYANANVLEFLEWELRDKYRGIERAAVETPRLYVLFEPDKDVYEPGEPVHVQATVKRSSETAPPVAQATIHVQFAWAGPLPGAPAVSAPPLSAPVRLQPEGGAPGHFTGTLPAPALEGFYRVQAAVSVPGQRLLSLEELIAVEAA